MESPRLSNKRELIALEIPTVGHLCRITRKVVINDVASPPDVASTQRWTRSHFLLFSPSHFSGSKGGISEEARDLQACPVRFPLSPDDQLGAGGGDVIDI